MHATTDRPLVVILAAGAGTRMHSKRPKVLQELAGRPLLGWVLETARALEPGEIRVVTGRESQAIRAAFPDADIRFVEQSQPLGTGHALRVALDGVRGSLRVLVLYGDVPLLSSVELRALIDAAQPGHLALLTALLDDAEGYGRIVRDPEGRIRSIVEQADLTDPEMLAIREVNTGVLAASAEDLVTLLPRLRNDNAQHEFYLTDLVPEALATGFTVSTRLASDAKRTLGINRACDLAMAESKIRTLITGKLLDQGVRIRDPARFDLRGVLEAGSDVEIDVGVVLEGSVRLGDGVRIGPYCILRDVELGSGSEVFSHCVLEGVKAGRNVRIGPFARIRPETSLGEGDRIGNFVEIKNTRMGADSKANHLSYVGDAEVGKKVNLGAGVITVNYDGTHKHRTVIEDEVMVGCDVQLVAPVTIGRGAFIGAGSTIVRDAPPGGLTLARTEQKTITDWKRPGRKD
ncbi:MAG: bifunctional UDP-N-acetylglucosamine diphosphorylase/glucosamine-1-phosphate N-acetyltransferase GlmU [Gammaproteobacteria bacterium]